MDLYKAIQDLYAEKEKLERVIASLEELQRTAGAVPVLPAKACQAPRPQVDEFGGAAGSLRAHAEVLGQAPQRSAGVQTHARRQLLRAAGRALQGSPPLDSGVRLRCNKICLFLEEPEPVILVARAVLVAHFESAAIAPFRRASCSENVTPTQLWPAIGLHVRRALNLEFEQTAGTQQPVHFAHVVFNDRRGWGCAGKP